MYPLRPRSNLVEVKKNCYIVIYLFYIPFICICHIIQEKNWLLNLFIFLEFVVMMMLMNGLVFSSFLFLFCGIILPACEDAFLF